MQLKEKVYIHGETFNVRVDEYLENDKFALSLVDNDGMLVQRATVNVDKLDTYQVGIKNYSEGEGMDNALVAAEIIDKEPVRHVSSGFVTIPIYELSDSVRDQVWKGGSFT